MTHPKVARLHTALQHALEVELFTIPPYLTALYSIDEGSNAGSAAIIQSVVMEEMLHAMLVANIMNAVGGSPQVLAKPGGPRQVRYPAQAPHIARKFTLGLLPFSPGAVEAFKSIEAPETPRTRRGSGVYSIGQLYEGVRNLITEVTMLLGEQTVFCGAPGRQFSNEDYYGAGGRVTAVRGLNDALAAIDEISQQGEGRVTTVLTGDDVRFDQPKEVAHYYRFEQILAERYFAEDDVVGERPTGSRLLLDWGAVRPIGTAPSGKTAHAAKGLAKQLAGFEQCYGELLGTLHKAFNGRKAAINDAVPAMQRLKTLSIQLMKVPIGSGKTCPPPFWFIES